MQSTLPLHRRARTWYGARTAPTEALHHAPAARRVRLPRLAVAPLPPELRKAPVDRRRTALL